MHTHINYTFTKVSGNCTFSCRVGVTVSFSQPAYTVNEGDRLVQPVLLFSNPSSFEVRVRIRDSSQSATR